MGTICSVLGSATVLASEQHQELKSGNVRFLEGFGPVVAADRFNPVVNFENPIGIQPFNTVTPLSIERGTGASHAGLMRGRASFTVTASSTNRKTWIVWIDDNSGAVNGTSNSGTFTSNQTNAIRHGRWVPESAVSNPTSAGTIQ